MINKLQNMGNCTSKIPSDNSYQSITLNPHHTAPNPLIVPINGGNDTDNDTLTIDTSVNDVISSSSSKLSDDQDIVVLLELNKRRLLLYGYAQYYCNMVIPIDILEEIILIFLDESFYWKIRYDQLYKLRHDTDSIVSFTSKIFIYRNIKFQLQLTKILKSNNDHGFQLSARLLSKNVIVTTTIALLCDETHCGYHNFVENFFESGWPSSTLKLSDIDQDLIELNFICKFDILRIIPQPIMMAYNDNAIQSFYKNVKMKQKVEILWSLNNSISPSYRTDNDDASLILFYESPQFENGSYVVHFIQSSVLERDGFAVMLELFTYPKGVTKITIKWIVIVSYDGKIIKKSSTDHFALNDSCHSKAFSKSDFHFIGETNIFSLNLLKIKLDIQILEIYDQYDQIIKWKNIRHWPKFGIFHQNPNNYNNDNGKNQMDHSISSITKLETKMKKLDDKLNQILSIQNGSGIHNDSGKIINCYTNNNSDCINNLKQWLSKEVGLPNYCNLLIQNGFNSLEMMKEINNFNDLDYIGITLKAHQLRFLNQIKKLQLN